MRQKIRHILISMLCMVSGLSYGQDPQFSQFYASPMTLNPAFTGNTLMGRASANYRNQWPSIPGAFRSYSLAYDHNMRSINSGLGIMLVKDKAGSAGLRYSSTGFAYAYSVNIARELAVRAGIRGAYVRRELDPASVILGDQLLENQGGAGSAHQFAKLAYPDFAAGMLLYGRKYWIGISGDHLNKPNQSLIGGEAFVPIKYSVHGGYNLTLTRNDKGQPTTRMILSGQYKAAERWDQLDLGAYVHYQMVMVGAWYRGIPGLKKNPYEYSKHINQDALVLLIAAEYEKIRIGYSYDITISRLAGRSGNAHELAVIYEYATKKKKITHRKHFVVPCPKF